MKSNREKNLSEIIIIRRFEMSLMDKYHQKLAAFLAEVGVAKIIE